LSALHEHLQYFSPYTRHNVSTNVFLNSSDPSRTVLALPRTYLNVRQLTERAVLRRHSDKREVSGGLT